jgi:hypothetical protein
MFDIVHKFNVLLCFNQGRNTTNESIHTEDHCIDNAVSPQHGSPEHSHGVPTTEAHDGYIVL